jgi:archaellum component FlaC
MKRFIGRLFLAITFLLTVSNTSLAQNSAKESPPDQAMKELLSEVRLLRQDLRKLSSTTYRAHTMIERLRVQQSQVNRLMTELSNVRGQLASIKSGRLELKEQIKELQKRWDSGAIPETELIAAKGALADMDQREPDLTLKESELAGQLIIERTNLEAINKRLDDIEQELLSITQDDDKRVKRTPSAPQRYQKHH